MKPRINTDRHRWQFLIISVHQRDPCPPSAGVVAFLPMRRSRISGLPVRVRTQTGHTLAELIIVIGISAFMFLTITLMTSGTLQAMDHLSRRAEVDHEALYAVRRISMALASALDLTATQQPSITFIVPDITGDAVDDEIRYQLSGRTLLRSVNGTSTAIAENVSLCSFEYVYEDQDATIILPEGEIEEVTIAEFNGFPAVSGDERKPRPLFNVNFGRAVLERFVAKADAEKATSLKIRGANGLLIRLRVDLIDKTDMTSVAHGTVLIAGGSTVRDYIVPLSWTPPDDRGIRKGRTYHVMLQSEVGLTSAGSVEYARIDDWEDDVESWDNQMMFYYWDGFTWADYGDEAELVFTLKGLKRRHHGRRDKLTTTSPKAVNMTIQTDLGGYQSRQQAQVRLLNY